MKIIVALLSLILGVGAVCAQGTFQFVANLSGANEIPPNNGPYIGGGSFTLNGSTVLYFMTTGLISAPTSPATITGPGIGGPVVYSFSQPPILMYQQARGPLGYLWGQATFTLTSGQIAELQSGQLWVNIPTINFPGGELAGQILPVPEPSSLMLLALGCGLFGVPTLATFRTRRMRGGK